VLSSPPRLSVLSGTVIISRHSVVCFSLDQTAGHMPAASGSFQTHLTDGLPSQRSRYLCDLVNLAHKVRFYKQYLICSGLRLTFRASDVHNDDTPRGVSGRFYRMEIYTCV
jgi:hypothetical protein